MRLNSLDLAGFEIVESSWLTDTTKTVAGADDTSAGDATELKWEFDEDSGRYYVSFRDDQWRSPVGAIEALAFGVVFIYVGSVAGLCVHLEWLYN